MKTRKDVATYLNDCIRRSGKTQTVIATEAGFPTPNVISMMKSGRFKIPLSRIPALAKSLATDPQEMLGYCLEAYEPELYQLFASLAPSMLVTSREFRVIRALRGAARSGAFS